MAMAFKVLGAPLLALLIGTLPACAWLSPKPTESERIALGAQRYATYCAACHGDRGQGRIGPALDATQHAWHHPDAQLREFITQGKWGPLTQMPAFGEALSDSEVEAIIALIKSGWSEEQRRIQADLTLRYAP